MNEIISSILEAEKKADSLVSEAQANAKKSVLFADAEGEKIKENAIDSFKTARKEALLKAEKDGDELYGKIASDGEKQAEEITALAKNNLEKTADLIIKEIIK